MAKRIWQFIKGRIKGISEYFGVFGIVFLLFGILSFLLDLLQAKGAKFSLYPMINCGAGLLLVVFYFIFNSGIFKRMYTEKTARYGANALIYTLLFFGVLVFVNVISVNDPTMSKKWDLTANKVYSLADQTIKLLKNLDEKVEVMGFYNVGANERTAIKDLLERYRYHSNKLTYKFYDADENPQLAKELEVTNGVMLVKYKENKTKVSAISEEEITNAIKQITKKGEKKIYFLSGQSGGDVDDENSEGFSIIKKFIENEGYATGKVNLMEEKEVPKDCSILLVLGPSTQFSDSELQKIEQYISEGGNSFFLISPPPNQERTGLVDTGISKVLSKIGVSLGSNIILYEMELPAILQKLVGRQVKPQVTIDKYEMHDITKDYDKRTVLGFSRSLSEVTGVTGVTTKPLLKVNQTAYWGETNIKSIFDSTADRDSADLTGEMIVGITSEKEPDAGSEKRNPKGKSVVIGNSSFVNNGSIPASSNLNFFLNSINWMSGEEEKISIRPRSIKTSKLTWTAEEAKRIFYIAVLMVPEIVLLFGLGVWRWRKKK